MFTHIPTNSDIVSEKEHSYAPSYIYVMCPYPVFIMPDQNMMPSSHTPETKNEPQQTQVPTSQENQNLERVEEN